MCHIREEEVEEVLEAELVDPRRRRIRLRSGPLSSGVLFDLLYRMVAAE